MALSAFRRRASVVAITITAIAIALPGSASEASGDQEEAATACIPANKCCRVCDAGKACGNSCIKATKACHKGRGCACNQADVCE